MTNLIKEHSNNPLVGEPVQMKSAAKRLLADIRELAPAIIARAAEIEAGRRIPLDLVNTLKAVGAFRLFVPRSHVLRAGRGRRPL